MTEFTLTINKGTNVCQHEYHSTLRPDDFYALMMSEWMINPDNDDQLTLDHKTPVA